MRGSGASDSSMRLVLANARRFIQTQPFRRAMISNREWMSLCLAGLCVGSIAIAQDTGGAAAGGGSAGSGGSTGEGSKGGSTTSGTDSSGTGSKPSGTKPGDKSTDKAPDSAPGTEPPDPTTPGGAPPKTGGTSDPFIPTKSKTDKPGGTNEPGASSSFGTTGEKPAGEPDTTEGGPTGPSSAFGPGDTTATQKAAPPSFTLPGFFGGGSTTYTGGQGRLARPRFRFKVTVSQGFDDNPLQSPDNPQEIPDQQVLVDPGTPDTVTFVPVTTTTYEQAFAGPIIYFRPVTTTTFQRVVTPASAPVIRTIRAPEAQKREGSLVSHLGLRFDTQQVTRRSLFTLDLDGSVDHYWNRPGIDGSDDYSGSFSMAYLYNITPRLQASLTTNIAYISQPDYTRINTPDRLGAGDLVNALARLNVSYRLTPRFTTNLSVGQNAVIFLDQNVGTRVGAALNGDTYETTFSAEAKYLWKPRYTLLTEFRHVLINYPDASSLNATTELLLLGAELKLSSRLSATVRLGEAVRIFDESGDSASSPYGEAVVNYRIGPTSSVQWNSRFGYEQPQNVSTESLSYRTTVNYFKNFTPRLSLSAGITGVSQYYTVEGAEDNTQQIISANIALEYHYSRQLTLNATFSFTKVVSTSGDLDYDRSRIFLGAEYEF